MSHHRVTLTRTFKTKSPPLTGATPQQEIFQRSPAFLLPFFRKGRRDEGGHESSCTSCNLLGQKAFAGFLRTSYPRSRSANSAEFRIRETRSPPLPSREIVLFKFRRAQPRGIFLSCAVTRPYPLPPPVRGMRKGGWLFCTGGGVLFYISHFKGGLHPPLKPLFAVGQG